MLRTMKTTAGLWLAFVLLIASPAAAHVALSSVDVHIRAGAVEVSVVAQAYDFAHDLGIDPAEKLMDLAFLAQQRNALATLVEAGVLVSVDGEPLGRAAWALPEAA